MTDDATKIELEAAKDPSLIATLARLRDQGVDPDTAVLKMGYTRRSSPLLGDIRAASVVAVDADGHAAELVHMPLENIDPITLDSMLIENLLLARGMKATGAVALASDIVDALRAGTANPKES